MLGSGLDENRLEDPMGHWGGWGGPGRVLRMGEGPPFDPEEFGTPTQHSLLLPHFAVGQMKAKRKEKKQGTELKRNRGQVRTGCPSPSAVDPVARAVQRPHCRPSCLMHCVRTSLHAAGGVSRC